jgi:site-specific recombinase XerD
MLRAGVDLLTLQRLLGHGDISLLKRYAKQNTDDLRLAHAKVSPVDQAGIF